MGVELKVICPGGTVPAWARVRDFLAQRAQAVELRMIDGELAFPDEAPPESWRELRLSTSSGMVTLRREPGHVSLVVWGNADRPLLLDRNALALAYAELSAGQVVSEAGSFTAAELRRAAELPPSFLT
jgi:hypothetical protein